LNGLVIKGFSGGIVSIQSPLGKIVTGDRGMSKVRQPSYM
jgi:hypothetical protein